MRCEPGSPRLRKLPSLGEIPDRRLFLKPGAMVVLALADRSLLPQAAISQTRLLRGSNGKMSKGSRRVIRITVGAPSRF
jgi:hypothetical protein